ncbi:MAG TPA: hypothetical protein VK789_09425 [Bryobacteraceae bacterium]|jgi:hypothetical protein|nr:hypothetical protein [Bryobacteraceae bacterium]
MARLRDDSKQTGFRIERVLLNEFQSRLAREGRKMGPVLEGWIKSWLNGEQMSKPRREPPPPGEHCPLCRITI